MCACSGLIINEYAWALARSTIYLIQGMKVGSWDTIARYGKQMTFMCRIYSGRQLLTDYRYIQKWLTSSDQQLSNGALQVLSKLPISKEIERGLLTICGTADMDQTDSAVGLSSTAEGPHQQVLLLSHNFLVLNEMAWNTLKDWEECVA